MRRPFRELPQIIGPSYRYSAGTQGEKRGAGRIELPVQTVIYSINDTLIGPPHAVNVRDVSVQGIGINTPHAIVSGRQFIISLPRQHSEPLFIYCLVTRWQPLGREQSIVGANFVELAESLPQLVVHGPALVDLQSAGDSAYREVA
jgi:hypothetical protein